MNINSIVDCCWWLAMRAVFWVAYAIAALIWAMFIWVALFMLIETSVFDRIALATYGGVPFGLLLIVERSISRKSKQS
ncbi:MAG: hypothetical protein JSS49_03430 [Planctomycetes bacterium]|nr:hypothetical protein [Planctomycetota bacterium]